MHNKDLGQYGEAIVIQQLIEHGCSVFKEFGDNSKIYIIIETKNKELFKIQVKTCNRYKKDNNVTPVYLKKSGANYKFKYTSNDIDYFAVVDINSKMIAWLNMAEWELQDSINLRHAPPLNGTTNGLHYFSNYIKFPFGNKVLPPIIVEHKTRKISSYVTKCHDKWPSKEELQKLLWEIPSTHIAKKFKVSDNTIKDWAKFYGVSKPPRGYWKTLKHNGS